IRRHFQMAMQRTALVKSAKGVDGNRWAKGQSAIDAQGAVSRAVAATHETLLRAVVNSIRVNSPARRRCVEWSDTQRFVIDARTDSEALRRFVAGAIIIGKVHGFGRRFKFQLRDEGATGIAVGDQNRIAAQRSRKWIGHEQRSLPG